MVRELEAQEVGGFVDVMAVHQEVLSLFNYEGMDVADGRTAGGFVDHVAQVAGRIGQLLGAILD